jgi:hypothetical protein
MSDSEKSDSKSSGEAFQFFAGLVVSVTFNTGGRLRLQLGPGHE